MILSSLAITILAVETGPGLFNIGVGIATVVAGLIVGIGMISQKIKKLLKNKSPEPQTDESLDQYEKEVDQVIDETLKLVFPINLQTHSFVHERITEFRVLNNADFVTICYFHNGGNFLDGSPIKRISSVFESLKEGKESFSYYFKNVFVSEVLPILQSIDVAKVAIIETTKLENGLLRTLLTTKDVHHLACIPVTKSTQLSGHLVIGVLLVGFSSEETKNFGELQESVVQHSKKLAALLEMQLFGDRPYFCEG